MQIFYFADCSDCLTTLQADSKAYSKVNYPSSCWSLIWQKDGMAELLKNKLILKQTS